MKINIPKEWFESRAHLEEGEVGAGSEKGFQSDCLDYSIALQQAIEYHCKSLSVPKSIANKCPHHAHKLNSHLARETTVQILEKCIHKEGSAVIYLDQDGGYILCSDNIPDTHGTTLPLAIDQYAKKLFIN